MHAARPLVELALTLPCLLLGGATTLAQSPAQQLLFPTSKSAQPLRIASGAIVDLDGDGRADLAGVSSAGGNTGIASLSGAGDGTFGALHAATATPTPTFIELLETIDVNGDGLPDVVHGRASVGLLYVYLATGAGTYTTPSSFPTPDEVHDVAAADFDLDGDVDLAATTAANGSPSFSSTAVLLGDGRGDFSAQSSIPTGHQPRGIVASDLDGDGRADLAILSETLAQVRVFLGLGSGNFVAAGAFPVGLVDPDALLAADLDADGDDDLVALGEFEGARVLLGTGRAAFAPAQALAGGAGLRSPARLVDLDGDTDVDLVATSTQGGIGVALAHGDGAFATPQRYGGFYAPIDVAAGDVDGDARADVALSDFSSGGFALLRNLGAGALAGALPIALELAGKQPLGELDLRDIDGDGHLDLARGAAVGVSGTSGALVVAHGDGSGGFGAPAAYASIGSTLAAGGDLDNDGLFDYVLASSAIVQPLLQRPDGTFHDVAPVNAGGGVLSGVAADLDGDAVLDLVLPAPGSQWLARLQGNGDATFGAGTQYLLGGKPVLARCADFDNDGDLDVIAAENLQQNGLYLFANPGGSTLLPPVVDPLPFVTQVEPLDYDDDGDVDLAIASTRALVKLGDGAGGFGAAQQLTQKAVQVSLAFGDYDGDGELDLAGGTSQVLHVWLGNGATQLGPSTSFIAGGAPLARDVDEDGRLDVVVATSDDPLWLRNQHAEPQIGAVQGLAAAGAGGVSVSGAGFTPSSTVTIDGAPVASTWISSRALELALAPHAPGRFDVLVSNAFGSVIASDALARWPTLGAGAAALGAPLALTLENGGPGVCALAVSGTLLPSPLALPGIHHALALANPLLLQVALVPQSGVHAASFAIPNDPQLAGVALHLQAWASQPGQAVTPDSSFANVATVVVP